VDTQLDTFAQTVYEAYGSFRVAGFDRDQAFQLARDFLRAVIDKQEAPHG
jgi:predicted HAD superfamily Cof-like phosphohydrolase